jgi:hypothetical protein
MPQKIVDGLWPATFRAVPAWDTLGRRAVALYTGDHEGDCTGIELANARTLITTVAEAIRQHDEDEALCQDKASVAPA